MSPSKGPRQKKRGQGSPLLSLVISVFLFVGLLQVFDLSEPLAETTHQQQQQPPSAVEVGLADFSKGHTTEFNDTHIRQASSGREPILQLLKEAGISDLSPQQISRLPRWEHVVDLYGPKVVIVGKNRCDQFRKKVRLTDRKVGVAGLFNTGTNLLQLHLFRNIHGVESLWQVPWGKHRMAAVKWNHTANRMDKYNKEHVLPIVIVRDPLAWLQSMCAHPYAAHWRHDEHHCPNLVPNEDDTKRYDHLKETFQVTVRYDKDKQTHWIFDSLVHFWSEYHRQYLDADYPVLLSKSLFVIVWFFAGCCAFVSVQYAEHGNPYNVPVTDPFSCMR